MTCQQVRGRGQAWLDHALEGAEARAVEAHLAQCPSCRREVEALRTLDRVLTGEELVAPPPGMAARITRRLATRFAARGVRMVPVWMEALTFTGVATASAMAAFVGLGLVAQAAGLVLTTSLTIGVMAAAASLALAGASTMYYEV